MKLKDLLKDIEYISNIKESQLEDIETDAFTITG